MLLVSVIRSDGLCLRLAQKLRDEQGLKPYVIPMGGSNAIGLWGYLEMVRELVAQQAQFGVHFDHIVMACGSGGTASGIALGFRLLQLKKALGGAKPPHIHGVCVCDTPEFFYKHVREVMEESGLSITGRPSTEAEPGANAPALGDPTEWLSLYNGKGLGSVFGVNL